MTASSFEDFDKNHYEVENKLIALIKSLQSRQQNGTWDNQIHEREIGYNESL